MAAGGSANHSQVDNSNPCYEINLISLKLTSTPSVKCVLLQVFLGSISVIIVCGNLLVIVSVLHFKQLHTPTNFLILSLAVADLLVGILILPLSTMIQGNFCLYFPHILCKVRVSCDIFLSTASILNLCCISIDRYYAVCQPLTYRAKINFIVVEVMIMVTWSVSVLITVGFVIASLISEKCQENCYLGVLLVNTVGPVFSFYLPVMVMVCIYLKILLVAQKQARSIQNTKTRATGRKGEGKATKTLAIVMGAFLLCWTPFFLCVMIDSFKAALVPGLAFEILIWIGLFNSLFNPFIYAFFYSWFRSAFRLILTATILKGDFSNTKLL